MLDLMLAVCQPRPELLFAILCQQQLLCVPFLYVEKVTTKPLQFGGQLVVAVLSAGMLVARGGRSLRSGRKAGEKWSRMRRAYAGWGSAAGPSGFMDRSPFTMLQITAHADRRVTMTKQTARQEADCELGCCWLHLFYSCSIVHVPYGAGLVTFATTRPISEGQ